MAATKRNAPSIDDILGDVITSASLDEIVFAPIKYLVEGLVTEGATLLAGAPKIGKSWMAINIAHAIATGQPVFGNVPTKQGDVLYIALEDNQRRLQSRLRRMGAAPSRHLAFATRWLMLEEGALEAMERWITQVENPVLIVVDVLTKIRLPLRGNEQNYEADYHALGGMQTLAGLHNIAILIVHHTRKADADDPFDTVSGTRGLTGAADTVLVLRRDFANKRAKIYGRGRDIAEIEMAMGFDGQTGLWRQLDALEAAAVTPEREAIVRVLVEAGEPLSAKTIAERGGLDYSTSRKILGRMADNGVIAKEGRGLFAWEGPGNAGNRANDDERSDLLDLG